MAPKSKKPPVSDLIDQIREYNGNLAAVARLHGVTRTTIYNWTRDSALCQEALADARETMLDEAENILYQKVLAGETQELIFFLKTKGKNRGYVPRNELTGEDGEALHIVIDR